MEPESHGEDGSSSGQSGPEPGRNKSDNIKNDSLSTPSTTSPVSAAIPGKQFTAPTSAASTSPRDSPRSSRNTSPTRAIPRQELPNTSKGMKSRNGSHEMSPSRPPPGSAAPHQTVPSAAALQRALSSAAAPPPHQIAVPDPQARLPKPQKTTGSVVTSSETTPPHWPVSPRLKSPSPSAGSRRNSLLNPATQAQRKTDSASAPVTPSIVVQRSTPGSTTPASSIGEPLSAQSDESYPTPPKTSKSISLETVQENNSPGKGEPRSAASERHLSGKTNIRSSEDDRPPTISEDSTEESGEKVSKTGESESESGGNKSDGRGRRPGQNGQNTPRAKANSAQRQYAPLAPPKPRSGQENSGNMTVETETVSSVPQATLSGGSERSGNSRGEGGPGSLRLKPSTETIRPKKDRKKASRKQHSIQSGTGGSHYHWFSSSDQQQNNDNKTCRTPTRPNLHSANSSRLLQHHRSNSTKSGFAQSSLLSPADAETPKALSPALRRLTDFGLRKASSKADIFEAKVASAVDEANSSDSDETFVYESNQPETHARPRDHSRTPSVASIASQLDPRGGPRTMGDALASGHRIAGKRSMKFSSAYNDADSPDHRNDSIRSGNLRSGGSGTHLHHHIGRHGRSAGTHTPVLDTDVPVSGARNARSRPSSRPASATQNHFPHRTKKNGEVPFDIDVEGADDERMPLIGTVRTPRNRNHRNRPGSASLRQMDYYQNRRRSWVARFAGCIVIAIMFALVIIGAVGFLFATTKPLYDVAIKEIQNVLASEQELMLDLLVEAVNPNIIAVSITDMDVNVFAKSKHLGADPPSPFGPSQSLHRRRTIGDRSTSSVAPKSAPTSSSSAEVVASGWPPFWDPDPDGVDHGTDPMPDPSGDSSTMLLGRIFHFDSALSFDGSPLKRHPHYSVGELRLTKPGNKTESGGSERWEKVLEYPFELIVRGVLKYQLPLTGKAKTVAIGRSVIVHPEEGVDENGGMRTEPGWGLGPGPRIDQEVDKELEGVDKGENEMGWDPV